MNLPNYFLADLPPEATLTAAMIGDACQTLKRNREKYLIARSTQALVEILCAVAENWLQSEYPFRKLALQNGPEITGFSRGTLASGLDDFFKQFTPENFNALLVQDLGHARRLDEIVSNTAEEKHARAAVARGPELLAHIAAGNIPNPTLMSIALGVLARSAQFVKCASNASFLPRLFAHSLYDAEPKLGACLEIAAWRGGRSDIEKVLFEEADCITATGSDEALAAIRHHVPARARFLTYGQRLSFAYVAVPTR